MSSSPAVVVKKGGPLTALVSGVFGTLIAVIICGSAMSLYAVNMVDRRAAQVIDLGETVLWSLPEWSEKLPPAVADLLNDRRAPDYRNQLDVDVKLTSSGRETLAILSVENTGDATVTLLTARLVMKNEQGVPRLERRVYAATPLTIDEEEWRGPLLPGSTREFAVHLWRCDEEGLAPSIELTDLRVWTGQPTAAMASPPAGAVDEES